MFRRNSRVIATIVAASVSGAVIATMAPAGAVPASSPRAEVDIFGAMNAANDQLDALSSEVVAAQSALQEAEGALPGAQVQYDAAQAAAAQAAAADAAAAAALAEAEAAVAKTKSEIEEKQARIEGLKGELSSFARDVYTSGGGQLAEMGVVLGSQSPADVASGLESIEKVSRGKNKVLADYTAAKADLDRALVDLEQQQIQAQDRREAAASALAAASDTAAQAAAARDNLQALARQRSEAVLVIENRRQEVRQQYDDLKAAQSQIEQMLRDREAERQRVLAEQARRAVEERAAKEAEQKAAQEAAAQAAAEAAAAQAAAEEAAKTEAAKAAEQAAAVQAAAEEAARVQAERSAAAAEQAAAAEAARVAEETAKAAAEQRAAETAQRAAEAQQQAAAQAAAEAAQAAEQAAAEAAKAASEQAAAQAEYDQAVADAVVRRWQAEAAYAAEQEAAAAAVRAAEEEQAAAAAAAEEAQQAARNATNNIPTFDNSNSPSFVPEPTSQPTSSGGWIYPVSGGFNSSPPGPRAHPAYGYWACHKGEDIAAPLGTPIVATHSGTVISAGWNNGGYGIMTIVDHGDGTSSLYAHQNSVNVSSGQYVSAGQVIGYVGSTGDSTGPHLHFEIHVGGVAYLPSGWFGGSYGPVPC
jgi:murein DD-endopeptidase MepM/ murein hydrolase activator NlpD